MRETDEQLARAAGRGDDAAFHELVDRHADRLYGLAFRLVGNAPDAEDVLQESLLGALEQIGRFEERSTVKTWLSRIVVRQAAHHHRRSAVRRTQSVPAGYADSSAGNVGERIGRRMDVSRALAALSDDHREVVVLREFEGLSYAEMARELGVPRGTVESRLHRARGELKRLLSDYLAQPDAQGPQEAET